jgi:hypothetical protein
VFAVIGSESPCPQQALAASHYVHKKPAGTTVVPATTVLIPKPHCLSRISSCTLTKGTPRDVPEIRTPTAEHTRALALQPQIKKVHSEYINEPGMK